MAGKPNNAKNRSLAYCELVRMYPEGVFKGFSFPNLSKKEDYTLQILSGKRGETASISVAESENGNSDEEELELGSDAGSDEEVINAGAQSEVRITNDSVPKLCRCEQAVFFSESHSGNTVLDHVRESSRKPREYSAQEEVQHSSRLGRSLHLDTSGWRLPA